MHKALQSTNYTGIYQNILNNEIEQSAKSKAGVD